MTPRGLSCMAARCGRIGARLVTVTGVTGGAMAQVPRRLGQAFGPCWNRQRGSHPRGITTGLLRWRAPGGPPV